MEALEVCACGETLTLKWEKGESEVRTECPSCGRLIIAKVDKDGILQIEFVPKEMTEEIA